MKELLSLLLSLGYRLGYPAQSLIHVPINLFVFYYASVV